ncbi:hypothetical protein BU17DRAFT_61989 [Hysterangium stoloniferum]|nr:hypothetical protein BU17DRAFT_61989 [Hysterangium stoloniferum]
MKLQRGKLGLGKLDGMDLSFEGVGMVTGLPHTQQPGTAVYITRTTHRWLLLTTAELRTCETSNRDDSMYKDPWAVPGIEESPHLFEAPPITTTANIVINDSCDRDGCKSMAHRNTQQMTEVVANRSLIVSQRDGRALLEGMLNRVISWMGKGMLMMG